MSDCVNIHEAAELLRGMRDVAILVHRRPDGDTLGSGFALWAALRELGIRAKVLCSDPIPQKYSFLTAFHDENSEDFEFCDVVAVDMAALSMAESNRPLAERCVLCIDHHGSNERYAKNLLLDADAAACCEIIYHVIKAMGLELTHYMATAVYLGLATDTGCFRFRNTAASTHHVAAAAMERGADADFINRSFFEQRSRRQIALEMLAFENMEFYFEGRAAVLTLYQSDLQRIGAEPADLEGVAGLARSIEGVEVGITMRELESGACKVSLRSHSVDSSAICKKFGGGGHFGAAGFECTGEFADIRMMLLREVEKAL